MGRKTELKVLIVKVWRLPKLDPKMQVFKYEKLNEPQAVKAKEITAETSQSTFWRLKT